MSGLLEHVKDKVPVCPGHALPNPYSYQLHPKQPVKEVGHGTTAN